MAPAMNRTRVMSVRATRPVREGGGRGGGVREGESEGRKGGREGGREGGEGESEGGREGGACYTCTCKENISAYPEIHVVGS